MIKRRIDDNALELIRDLLNDSTEKLEQYHEIVVRTLEYMVRNLQDKIGLPDVAARAHTSQAQLNRLFQDEVGMAPMHFLELLRVEKSKFILVKQRSRVQDAWAASGFGDLSTYEREFKKWVGCTPSEWKKRTLAKATPETNQGR